MVVTAARLQLVFLGPPGSGKTNLANNLVRPGFDEESDSTEGITLKSTAAVIPDSHKKLTNESRKQCGPLFREVSRINLITSIFAQDESKFLTQWVLRIMNDFWPMSRTIGFWLLIGVLVCLLIDATLLKCIQSVSAAFTAGALALTAAAAVGFCATHVAFVVLIFVFISTSQFGPVRLAGELIFHALYLATNLSIITDIAPKATSDFWATSLPAWWRSQITFTCFKLALGSFIYGIIIVFASNLYHAVIFVILSSTTITITYLAFNGVWNAVVSFLSMNWFEVLLIWIYFLLSSLILPFIIAVNGIVFRYLFENLPFAPTCYIGSIVAIICFFKLLKKLATFILSHIFMVLFRKISSEIAHNAQVCRDDQLQIHSRVNKNKSARCLVSPLQDTQWHSEIQSNTTSDQLYLQKGHVYHLNSLAALQCVERQPMIRKYIRGR